jgi:GNAT superfamily N-acetyltransferase
MVLTMGYVQLIRPILESKNETMNDIICYTATEYDIQSLVAFRVEFLTEYSGVPSGEQISALRRSLEQYFTSAINDRTYVCKMAKDGDKIVGIGGMAVRVHPGSFKNPSGVVGYIMNMYTIPSYRRKGICGNLLRRLMETGSEMGIVAFELHASKDGEPVYQKAGFEKHTEPTYRKYASRE